jgi:hypothetical protein
LPAEILAAGTPRSTLSNIEMATRRLWPPYGSM